jgi:hypothetical protein
MKRLACSLLLVALLDPAHGAPVRRDVHGAIYRSSAAVHAFRAATLCPATHTRTQHCPGFVVDHIHALACARTEAQRAQLDIPANMQYQSLADSHAKDRVERSPEACAETRMSLH